MGAKSFVDLKVWQVAFKTTMAIYDVTERFPVKEIYNLTSQMRRAVTSIGLNIAEGFGRRSPRDKAQFYTIAYGSTEELKHCLLQARGLKYLDNFEELWPDVESISKMLRSLTDCVLSDA